MRIEDRKPLKRKSYGSIGHLPNSRLGVGDHCVPPGQDKICTVKTRDKHDKIIVQEKLDGSCMAVTLKNGEILALGRAGYLAVTSPFEQHKMFAEWVRVNEKRFRYILREGERIVGEWLAQAHGTRYYLGSRDPWGVFDLMVEAKRVTLAVFRDRISDIFDMPNTLHEGQALSVENAMQLHQLSSWPCEEPEGIVYRVERNGKVDFLAKWVRPDKVDGKYLPEISGCDPTWNWII